MKPYILVAAKSTARLTDAVNDYIADGYEPTGAPWADHKSLPFQVERAPGAKVFQPKEKVWYQAMFRDPDMFDEREVTTPQPHQDAVDDAILEAFYSDKYPGHPDYKGEVIRTDDQMECNPQGESDRLERRLDFMETVVRELSETLEKERDEAIRRAERAEKRIEKEWWPNGRPRGGFL